MWKHILKATLLAGSLDIVAACIHGYATNGTTPDIILKYIASGLLGKDAFAGGYVVMALGLLFHYIIAFTCTFLFFLLYPKIKFLQYSVILNSLFIALVAWTITTRLIIPISKIQPRAFNINRASIAVGILFICIGLPISIATKKYYSHKRE